MICLRLLLKGPFTLSQVSRKPDKAVSAPRIVFDEGLGAGRGLFFDHQPGDAAHHDGGNVQNRSNHSLTESFPAKRARRKILRKH